MHAKILAINNAADGKNFEEYDDEFVYFEVIF